MITYKHYFRNEDGREFEHPGFEVRKCANCGRDFISAKSSLNRVCGDYKCGKDTVNA